MECSGLGVPDRMGAGSMVSGIAEGGGPSVAGGPVGRCLLGVSLLDLVDVVGRGGVVVVSYS